ncbi:hypothetical protein BDF14DRAFT_1741383 [Spinellus fusiger]|nr:hypothetical protein BDF14DRAFT_1741383 [Spinellus fusiger]
MLRSLVQVGGAARSVHTTAIRRSQGGSVFSRLNPWAKTPVVTPTEATEATETTTNDTPVPVFDVKYTEEPQFVSWKAYPPIEDLETLSSTVRSVVLETVADTQESQWETVSLREVATKFSVIKETMKRTGKLIPNHVLNDIHTAGDVLAYFNQEKVQTTAAASIEKYFEDHQDSLPANMSFAPRK